MPTIRKLGEGWTRGATLRAPANRRHLAQSLNRICKMTVFPLQLIATYPLPFGVLAKIGPGKAKGSRVHEAVRCAGMMMELRRGGGIRGT